MLLSKPKNSLHGMMIFDLMKGYVMILKKILLQICSSLRLFFYAILLVLGPMSFFFEIIRFVSLLLISGIMSKEVRSGFFFIYTQSQFSFQLSHKCSGKLNTDIS